jgi:NAD(P)-dependent dehydrogenase (short-subunit alcohol dehydrogenase family)
LERRRGSGRIEVNAVAPGPIQGHLNGKPGVKPQVLIGNNLEAPVVQAMRDAKYIAVARPVTFHPSYESNYVTESEISVDGGAWKL